MSLTKSITLARRANSLIPLILTSVIAGCAGDGLDRGSLQSAVDDAAASAAAAPVERSELPPLQAAAAAPAPADIASAALLSPIPGDSQPTPAQASEPAPALAGLEPLKPVAEAEAHKTSLKPETLAAIRDARSLKEAGNRARALGMLEKTPDSDKDPALLLERGLLSLELGQIERATELLKQAHDPKAPDWRQHSGLGSALATQGQQQAAQTEFAKALSLAPDNPAVMNNLALSYALDGKHTEAERLLRQASQAQSNAQAKQNLALILGLRGNVAEAKSLTEGVLPPDKVKSNIAYLEQLKTGATQVSRPEPAVPAETIRAIAQAAKEQATDTPIMNLGGPE